LRPLVRLDIVGAFARGFLAALMLPNGVDEGVMEALAPLVDTERIEGRRGSRVEAGGDFAIGSKEAAGDGEDGEGEPKGLSESYSSPGVEVTESMVG
jgi:hypothetical protein